MLKQNLKILNIILIFCFLSDLPAFAQRSKPMNIEDLVKKSEVIIHGIVEKVESGKDAQSGLLVTYITINVYENFNGAQTGKYTFKQYGGKADGLVYFPAGSPRFTENEEVILMLYPQSTKGMQSPVGMEQGKFSVVIDNRSGKKFVQNKTPNPNLFKHLKNPKTVSNKKWLKPVRIEKYDYVEFAETVRKLVSTLKTK
ncbi:MAG: hypothetical protein QME58_07995 [Bacteroidota bacterium]|nr:hypothetical protein [Bacteroidota bacterium]